MAETKQVRLCGFGGQGIILAGTILGYAAINDGKWVAGSSSYGAAARGGTCYSDVVISDGLIVYPHVIRADVLIALSQIAYDAYLKMVSPQDGTVIYDERLVSVRETDNLKQVGVSATELAIKELGSKQVANIVMLGAATLITKIVSKDALISAIDKNVPPRFRDLNLRAVDLGFKLGKAE
jgi:2-oxoglutarate ferredoxin oxidoreductase subunit gamma